MSNNTMTEAKWQKIIRTAKGFYFKGNSHRMKVAELAISACKIEHGGDRDRRFTIVRFARDIGMHSKTLHAWISIKKQVVDKVPSTIVKGLSYEKLRNVLQMVGPDSTTKEVTAAINSVRSISPVDRRFNKYIKVMKTILHNARTPIKLMEVNDEQISSILKYAKLITKFYSLEMEYRDKGSTGAKAQALKQVNRFNGAVIAAKATR